VFSLNQRFLCSLVVIAALNLSLKPVAAYETDFKLQREMIAPSGEYYEVTVPDTLDLAERGRLAVHGLTNFLNENKSYEPYGHGFFNTDPVYLTTRFGGSPEGGGAPNWGKIYDALVLTRHMSGSQEYLDLEEATFNGMIRYIRGGNSVPTARVMMALMSLNQKSPDPALEKLIGEMADSLRDAAKVNGNMAWFYDFEELPARMQDSKLGILGHGWQAFVHGSVLRAFSRWAKESGDKEYYELSEKLKNYVIQREIWEPESAPKAIVGHEHGQFMGHHHSYTSALMGILWYAEATGDVRLMQFVREGYEYLRTFGIASIGLFGEMCTVGDMTYLAVKLSQLGVGDYWEDVDRYTRNQLVEGQVIDGEKLRRAAAASPVLARIDPKDPRDPVQTPLEPGQDQVELVPLEETTDDVCERFVGAFLSECGWPTVIPKHRFMMVICCSGNATMGLYAAWDGIVEHQDGAAKVNLLLNRASEWLDVDSYLPYEGKVVVKNKTAKSISVRMPLWVDLQSVHCELNGDEIKPSFLGRYVLFNSTAPKDEITITFPVVEKQETYTLKWKKENFWQESTNPGHKWTPDPSPARFTFTLRGNTVVDVSPREDTGEYKLYERDHMKEGKAPLHKVKRFVSDRQIDW
jgi:hypothetical protein